MEETAKRERPRMVKTVAIINIITGGLGVVGAPFSIMQRKTSEELIRQMAVPGTEVFCEPFMRNWSVAGTVFGFIMGVVLICSGVGLLKLKGWGRKATLFYAVLQILWILAGFAVYYKVVIPRMSGIFSGQAPMMIGLIGGSLIGLIYPVFLLVALNMKTIREKFVPAAAKN